MLDFDEQMMKRCIQLAKNGFGTTYPNPMVGCVLVYENKIIAEGWHQRAGEPHGEVNAIAQIQNTEILQNSTLYVSLEPCAHYGKTPPCSDLIIRSKIPNVLIGITDPFSKVNGLGIQKMRNAGINVKAGILEKECRELNKRFIHFHEKKKPFIILKFAKTADGFMAAENEQKWISNEFSKQLSHKWRTEEQAILVGTKTADIDNPNLNARLWVGNQPIRIVLDKNLKLKPNMNLFDKTQKTLILNALRNEKQGNLEFIKLDFNENLIENILSELYKREIQSVIIEGGRKTLDGFINQNLWNEARIFTSAKNWYCGLRAPEIEGKLIESKFIGSDKLEIYKNESFL